MPGAPFRYTGKNRVSTGATPPTRPSTNFASNQGKEVVGSTRAMSPLAAPYEVTRMVNDGDDPAAKITRNLRGGRGQVISASPAGRPFGEDSFRADPVQGAEDPGERESGPPEKREPDEPETGHLESRVVCAQSDPAQNSPPSRHPSGPNRQDGVWYLVRQERLRTDLYWLETSAVIRSSLSG